MLNWAQYWDESMLNGCLSRKNESITKLTVPTGLILAHNFFSFFPHLLSLSFIFTLHFIGGFDVWIAYARLQACRNHSFIYMTLSSCLVDFERPCWYAFAHFDVCGCVRSMWCTGNISSSAHIIHVQIYVVYSQIEHILLLSSHTNMQLLGDFAYKKTQRPEKA